MVILRNFKFGFSRNLHVGDIILCEDSAPPTEWPVGEVMEVLPGKDNLVRMATVKTHADVRTRPVTKLALPLPSDQDLWSWLAVYCILDSLFLDYVYYLC